MQRAATIAGYAVLSIVALGVGWNAGRWLRDDAPPEAPEEAATEAAEGPAPATPVDRGSPPGPLQDPEDATPVDPPAHAAARMAPPPAEPGPPVTPVAPPTSPPHVVLVMGCTLRRDQLGLYGAPGDPSPFLDALARRGVAFDDTLVAAPWTRAAATAILTGSHAAHVGLAEPGPGRNERRLREEVVTLAERMDDLGYLTVGATANPNLREEYGFAQGFDLYQPGLPRQWDRKMPGTDVVERILPGLGAAHAAHPDQPVFLQLMLLDPHMPRFLVGERMARFVDPEEPARLAAYRAHVRAMDDALAGLERGLASAGIRPEDTLWVFLSDHGEGMSYPAHHGYAHGQYLMPGVVHGVWLMRGPGVAEGQQVRGVASQVDVVPTLLGALGHPLAADDDLDGRDLSAAARGERGLTERPMAFVDTWFATSARAAVVTADHLCQRDFGSGDRIRSKGRFDEGCFDRRADPLLTTPVGGQDRLVDTLVAWRERAERRLEALPAVRATVDDAVDEQLEALGYVDDPDAEAPPEAGPPAP